MSLWWKIIVEEIIKMRHEDTTQDFMKQLIKKKNYINWVSISQIKVNRDLYNQLVLFQMDIIERITTYENINYEWSMIIELNKKFDQLIQKINIFYSLPSRKWKKKLH